MTGAVLEKTETVSLDVYRYAMETSGYCYFPDVIPSPLLGRLRQAIDRTIEEDLLKGHTRGQYTYLAHNKDQSFVDLLELSPLQSYVDALLEETCILHSYNIIRIAPETNNPIQNQIHRDSQRFCRPYLLAIQILYLIDDFTLENGATYLLPGSHQCPDKPSEDYFYDHAVRMVGRAGDAVIFDSMVWHAGGANETQEHRRGITQVYTRPFMKQQIDLSRATPPDLVAQLSEQSRRLLGMNARVPASIEEFMLPPEERLYKPNQG